MFAKKGAKEIFVAKSQKNAKPRRDKIALLAIELNATRSRKRYMIVIAM